MTRSIKTALGCVVLMMVVACAMMLFTGSNIGIAAADSGNVAEVTIGSGTPVVYGTFAAALAF